MRPVAMFFCPSCARRRPMLGYRLRRVAGVRTWICGACAKRSEAAA